MQIHAVLKREDSLEAHLMQEITPAALAASAIYLPGMLTPCLSQVEKSKMNTTVPQLVAKEY